MHRLDTPEGWLSTRATPTLQARMGSPDALHPRPACLWMMEVDRKPGSHNQDRLRALSLDRSKGASSLVMTPLSSKRSPGCQMDMPDTLATPMTRKPSQTEHTLSLPDQQIRYIAVSGGKPCLIRKSPLQMFHVIAI